MQKLNAKSRTAGSAIKRRTFIAGAAALPAATGSAMTQLDGETPIMQLFRQHRAIIKTSLAHVSVAADEDVDGEMDRLFYDTAYRIEAEMMAIPCTCAADFAAKVIVGTCEGGVFSDWETGELWIEARALTGGPLTNADTVAGARPVTERA